VGFQQGGFPIDLPNRAINHSINWAHSTQYKFDVSLRSERKKDYGESSNIFVHQPKIK